MSATPPLEEFNLDCGYVDLVFATSHKKRDEIQNNFTDEQKSGLGKLELFLLSL